MGIRKEDFGITKQGFQASLYILENQDGVKVKVSDFGAVIVAIETKDKLGVVSDIVLGYPDVAGYEKNIPNFGACIGRHANRIGNAEFTLNGITYQLEKNDGKNHLHGGTNGYHRRPWAAEEMDSPLGDAVSFSLYSPDGDQGYPGNLDITVTYTLTEDNSLILSYRAVCDKDTILNITNHSYFNLSGHGSGDILKQKVWIDADYYTDADKESIPTGEILPVEGTPMDFRQIKPIGQDIDSTYQAIVYGQGYDHNWVLKTQGESKLVACMEDVDSGRGLEVYTDLPGLQFYTSNFLDGTEVGKEGAIYGRRSGACFESQYFPDSIHYKNFPSPILKAGEEFESQTVFHFYIVE